MPEMPSSGSLLHDVWLHALIDEVRLAGRVVEEAADRHRRLVVEADGDIGVLDVVDPRDVLVADALDAMLAEPVVEDGRALHRLGGGDDARRIQLLEVVTRADGACRPGGEGNAAEHVVGPHHRLDRLDHRRAGDRIVPEVVPELVELVEDDEVLARVPQLVALVEDLFDVRLRAGSLDDLARNAFEPLESLPTHALGQDGNGLAAEQVGVVGAAAAVVPRRRPHRLLRRWVELPGHQPRHQAAERSPDLVRAGGEPLALEHDDTSIDTRQFLGELEVVDRPVSATVGDGLVVPRDAEQVAGIEIPQAHALQLFLDVVRRETRIPHLGERRDEDVALPRPVRCRVEGRLVDGQVDHAGAPCIKCRAPWRGPRCRERW